MGKNWQGENKNMTSGHVLGGEPGAGKSHTEKPDKGPTLPTPPPGPAFYFHEHLTEAQLSHPGYRSCSTFFFIYFFYFLLSNSPF